jgi:hypothetical protein
MNNNNVFSKKSIKNKSQMEETPYWDNTAPLVGGLIEEEDELEKGKPLQGLALLKKIYGSSNQEQKGGKRTAKEIKKFIEASYNEKNPPKEIEGFLLDTELSNKTAKVYHNPTTGETVIAHRGTQGITDWGNNLAYVTGNYEKTDRYKKGKKNQKKAEAKYGAENISTLGHSQGAIIARKTGKNTKEIIGVNPASMGEKPLENEYNVRTSGDLVSMMLPSGKSVTTIKSKTSNPLTEHSAKNLKQIKNQQIGAGIKISYNDMNQLKGGRRRALNYSANDIDWFNDGLLDDGDDEMFGGDIFKDISKGAKSLGKKISKGTKSVVKKTGEIAKKGYQTVNKTALKQDWGGYIETVKEPLLEVLEPAMSVAMESAGVPAPVAETISASAVGSAKAVNFGKSLKGQGQKALTGAIHGAITGAVGSMTGGNPEEGAGRKRRRKIGGGAGASANNLPLPDISDEMIEDLYGNIPVDAEVIRELLLFEFNNNPRFLRDWHTWIETGRKTADFWLVINHIDNHIDDLAESKDGSGRRRRKVGGGGNQSTAPQETIQSTAPQETIQEQYDASLYAVVREFINMTHPGQSRNFIDLFSGIFFRELLDNNLIHLFMDMFNNGMIEDPAPQIIQLMEEVKKTVIERLTDHDQKIAGVRRMKGVPVSRASQIVSAIEAKSVKSAKKLIDLQKMKNPSKYLQKKYGHVELEEAHPSGVAKAKMVIAPKKAGIKVIALFTNAYYDNWVITDDGEVLELTKSKRFVVIKTKGSIKDAFDWLLKDRKKDLFVSNYTYNQATYTIRDRDKLKEYGLTLIVPSPNVLEIFYVNWFDNKQPYAKMIYDEAEINKPPRHEELVEAHPSTQARPKMVINQRIAEQFIDQYQQAEDYDQQQEEEQTPAKKKYVRPQRGVKGARGKRGEQKTAKMTEEEKKASRKATLAKARAKTISLSSEIKDVVKAIPTMNYLELTALKPTLIRFNNAERTKAEDNNLEKLKKAFNKRGEELKQSNQGRTKGMALARARDISNDDEVIEGFGRKGKGLTNKIVKHLDKDNKEMIKLHRAFQKHMDTEEATK